MISTFVVALALTAHALSAQTVPTWHLQLDHAIRPVEGTEGVLGDVSYMAVTSKGVVYVAERKIPRVTRYDATGKFVGVVLREGAGPGETREPEIVLFGDTLIVYDQRLTRLTRLSPSGKVLNEVHLDAHFAGAPISVTRNGTILLPYGFTRGGYNRNALRVSPAGRIDTVMWNERFADHQYNNWEFSGGVIKGGPFSAAPAAAIDPAGRIVFGGTRESHWFVLSGKDTVQRVTLADHLVTIPRAVRDSAWDAFLAQFARSTPAAVRELKKEMLPTTLPAWVSLNINPRGEWWIGRSGMDGMLASWDIVDNGKLVGHVILPARIAGASSNRRAGQTAFGSDLIAILHEDENAVPWIGVYRIVRSSR